ncbi:hypothetical protein GCM10020331_082170 [Ectobacillus funiculus]
MKWFIRLLVAALFVTAMAGCSKRNRKTLKKTGKKETKEVTLMLDWYPNAVHSFIYAAIEKKDISRKRALM